MMKSALLLSLLAIAFATSNCKKKEEHSERFNNLIGHWKLTELGKDTNHNGILDANERTPSPTDPGTEDEYFADGTGQSHFIITGVDNTSSFTWSLKDDEKTLEIVSGAGTSNQFTQGFPILSVTSQELITYYVSSLDSGYSVYKKI
jgi:hypothetical protein